MKRLVVGGAGVAALAAVAAWWWLRPAPARPSAPQVPGASGPAVVGGPVASGPPGVGSAGVGSAGPSVPSPGGPPEAPPVRPPSPAGAPEAGSAFDDEARAPAWAAEHEREMALRLRAVEEGLEARGVKVQIGPPECRQTQCRVSLAAGDSAALGSLYDALESEQGLHGWADSLLLERVETADDGRLETAVVAQFAGGP